MTANAAFAAALITFLIVAWTAGELAFLAPFKALLFHRHGSVIVGAILLLFLNLCAFCYGIARWVFLRDTIVTSINLTPTAVRIAIPEKSISGRKSTICRSSTATSTFPIFAWNTSGPTVATIARTSRSQRSTIAAHTPQARHGLDSHGIAQVAAESVRERAGEVVDRSIPTSPETFWNDMG